MVPPPDTPFAIAQSEEERTRIVQLRLRGELDLMAADALAARLAELKDAGRAVSLDLSRLEFIDCSGLRVLLGAMAAARRDGWSVHIAPHPAGCVERLVELTDVAAQLWPPDQQPRPSQARVAQALLQRAARAAQRAILRAGHDRRRPAGPGRSPAARPRPPTRRPPGQPRTDRPAWRKVQSGRTIH